MVSMTAELEVCLSIRETVVGFHTVLNYPVIASYTFHLCNTIFLELRRVAMTSDLMDSRVFFALDNCNM